MTRVKICGLTTLADAEHCLALGVDALGLNFWAQSRRRCDEQIAQQIVRAAAGRARVVAVTVDMPLTEVRALKRRLGIEWVQLHGEESEDDLRALLPHAYRALKETGELGVARARAAAGIEILVDASVPGVPGGSGVRADWEMAARIARQRPTWLAGGLTPDNVASAVSVIAPLGVDVASGVERAPGIKDGARVEAFVRAARAGVAPALQ